MGEVTALDLERQLQIAQENGAEFAEVADREKARADEAERLLASCRKDLSDAERSELKALRERDKALYCLRRIRELIND